MKILRVNCYRPQRSCGQGNVFTGVCLSTGGKGVCLSANWDASPIPGSRPSLDQADPPEPGRPPLTRQTPPPDQADPPRPGTPTTPTPGPGRPPSPDQADTPPREADSSIRSTSGRYASYWNAFLLSK